MESYLKWEIYLDCFSSRVIQDDWQPCSFGCPEICVFQCFLVILLQSTVINFLFIKDPRSSSWNRNIAVNCSVSRVCVCVSVSVNPMKAALVHQNIYHDDALCHQTWWPVSDLNGSPEVSYSYLSGSSFVFPRITPLVLCLRNGLLWQILYK